MVARITFTVVKNSLHAPSVQTIVRTPDNIAELRRVEQSLARRRLPVHQFARGVAGLQYTAVRGEVDCAHVRAVPTAHGGVFVPGADGQQVDEVVLAAHRNRVTRRAEADLADLRLLRVLLLVWRTTFVRTRCKKKIQSAGWAYEKQVTA